VFIDDLSLCTDVEEGNKLYAEYKQNIRALQRLFQHIFKECNVKDKTMEEISVDCFKLIQVLKHNGEAMLPRVALIGPRGSGKKTQAKLLRKRFGLIPSK
jgi:Adenylate kinase and related kinases